MRHFVYEMEDDETLNQASINIRDIYHTKVIYKKQRLFKLLVNPTKVRVNSTELRKAEVTNII